MQHTELFLAADVLLLPEAQTSQLLCSLLNPHTCIIAHARTLACKLVKQATQQAFPLFVTHILSVHKECILANPWQS